MNTWTITDENVSGADLILTAEALAFVSELQQRFNQRRQELLVERSIVAKRLREGWVPSYKPETSALRESAWQVAPAPKDLLDRRVEITGPVERKMMINALNSGAKVFMADFEDANSPTWENIISGQKNCYEAVRRTLRFESAGKVYELKSQIATLVIRPRGWHLQERNMTVNGEFVSASLFDFGLYFFHNAKEALSRGSGPSFYLPKLESHLEARLWNDVFIYASERLGVPRGSVRATVLIETILAAFEMEEILFELREHAAGLNAGRWDYLFSMIKKFAARSDVIFPDRAQLTMTVPFMKAYTEALVRTCHRRGAHAIGGMAAFIPSRKDPQVNENALQKVQEDKQREASGGFDGTWVAHPDLVAVAEAIFNQYLGDQPHQKDRHKDAASVNSDLFLPTPVEGGKVTFAGIDNNISVSLQYIAAWLQGQGAVAIFNLMEDAATAEISRAELWQWVLREVTVEGTIFTSREFLSRVDQIASELKSQGLKQIDGAREILKELVLSKEFTEFLTLPAYDRLVPLSRLGGNRYGHSGVFDSPAVN